MKIVHSNAECRFISFLIPFSLPPPPLMLFYVLCRISSVFPFLSQNDELHKDQVILMTLQLHKTTNVLAGKLRARSWQKVHLLVDTEGNLTFPLLLQILFLKGNSRAIKTVKMLLKVMTISIFHNNSRYHLPLLYYWGGNIPLQWGVGEEKNILFVTFVARSVETVWASCFKL